MRGKYQTKNSCFGCSTSHDTIYADIANASFPGVGRRRQSRLGSSTKETKRTNFSSGCLFQESFPSIDFNDELNDLLREISL